VELSLTKSELMKITRFARNFWTGSVFSGLTVQKTIRYENRSRPPCVTAFEVVGDYFKNPLAPVAFGLISSLRGSSRAKIRLTSGRNLSCTSTGIRTF
jgi:hypothetical protein